MKKLILVLLLLPCVANAQTWRVALSGGASIISKPDNAPSVYSDYRTKPGGVAVLSIACRFSEYFEVGIDIAALSLVRAADLQVYDHFGNPIGTYSDVHLQIGKLAFIATPSLSYHLQDFYFGPQIGYFITSGGDNSINNPFPLSQHYDFKDVRGFVGGAHLGFAHELFSDFSIFGELRGNYLAGNQMQNGVSVYGFNMFQLQMTTGINYEY